MNIQDPTYCVIEDSRLNKSEVRGQHSEVNACFIAPKMRIKLFSVYLHTIVLRIKHEEHKWVQGRV